MFGPPFDSPAGVRSPSMGELWGSCRYSELADPGERRKDTRFTPRR